MDGSFHFGTMDGSFHFGCPCMSPLPIPFVWSTCLQPPEPQKQAYAAAPTFTCTMLPEKTSLFFRFRRGSVPGP